MNFSFLIFCLAPFNFLYFPSWILRVFPFPILDICMPLWILWHRRVSAGSQSPITKWRRKASNRVAWLLSCELTFSQKRWFRVTILAHYLIKPPDTKWRRQMKNNTPFRKREIWGTERLNNFSKSNSQQSGLGQGQRSLKFTSHFPCLTLQWL